MRCPKCGSENPDDAHLCRSCSWILTGVSIVAPSPDVKTSRLAIASLVLAILSFLTLFITAIPAIVLGIVALVKIEKSAGQLKGKGFAAAGITITVIACLTVVPTIFFLWCLDAPTVPNDYTINDIRSAKPEYSQTYALLRSLANKDDHVMDAPTIGLSTEDIKNLKEINSIFKEKDFQTISQRLQANADNILTIWQNAKKGRDVIAKLDTFPEIADLTQPYIKYELSWVTNFRHLISLHRSYICLQSCKGNQETAVDELIKLDSILKKMSLNTRLLIIKLVCIACLAIDIQTANFIINNPETSHETLLVLKQHIGPFSDEHTSPRNSIIFEYLIFKNELRKITKEPRFRYSYFPPLKLNSTLRLFRNFCDKWIGIAEHQIQIKEFRVWPTLYPNLPAKIDSKYKLPWYYKTYNPLGSFFAVLLTPAMERVIEIRTKLEIHSDLLQIVLNKRLGKEVSLKASVYSDEYIIDLENRKIFSPGPDGRTNTKDDIKLMINPEVLGWQN